MKLRPSSAGYRANTFTKSLQLRKARRERRNKHREVRAPPVSPSRLVAELSSHLARSQLLVFDNRGYKPTGV